MISIIPISGIGKIAKGDDLAELFLNELQTYFPLLNSDCLVVASKVISKSRGRVEEITHENSKEKIIQRESKRILRKRDSLIISETHHGFICANAGIDESNTEENTVVLLPKEIDNAAHGLRKSILSICGFDISVVISDTFGRPFRMGETNVALGYSGLKSFADLRGTKDLYGKELSATTIAIADEIASAAELVMHKNSGNCAALVRGLPDSYRGEGKASDLIRKASEDLFR